MLARTALRARGLGKEPTPAEQTLWRLVRGSALDGLRFRRQHPIGRYIADFARASLIESLGWRVMHDLDRVLAAIREEALFIRGL